MMMMMMMAIGESVLCLMDEQKGKPNRTEPEAFWHKFLQHGISSSRLSIQ
jgi:hypothetical protein